MNFTREPIIETVVTPKEGCKLCVRNSKGVGQEEYLVDAVEVISFGKAHFFRSLEKPKSFLVPVTDYEVVEIKEAHMVLKGVGFEKSIKIGGGKEVRREVVEEKVVAEGEEILPEATPSSQPQQSQKRDRNKQRLRRKGRHHRQAEAFSSQQSPTAEGVSSVEASSEEKKEGEVAPIIRKLIPPPSTLIKEKLARIKGTIDEDLFPPAEITLSEGEVQKVEEKIEEKKEPEEEFPTLSQDHLD